MVRNRKSNSIARGATGEKEIEVLRLSLWAELGG